MNWLIRTEARYEIERLQHNQDTLARCKRHGVGTVWSAGNRNRPTAAERLHALRLDVEHDVELRRMHVRRIVCRRYEKRAFVACGIAGDHLADDERRTI